MAENIKNFPGAMEIVVDDGSVEVPIKNRQGDTLGVFYFRPTDMGIIDRYNQLAGDFEKITAPLENIDIAPDGTAQDEAAFAAMKQAEQNLYEACNKLFGGNMAGAFFGKMHPEDYEEAFKAALQFIDCGREWQENPKKSPRVMDWEQDGSLLFPAINKVARAQQSTDEMLKGADTGEQVDRVLEMEKLELEQPPT